MRGGHEQGGQQQQTATADDRVDPAGSGGRHEERDDHLRPRILCSHMPNIATPMKTTIEQQSALVNIRTP
ncbi:hypothetical protein Acy02nite_82630 [Actinoplanes cyaneus]|uniref:Uncharacterized protein n=1 Tax=Actinoplanes cyaneus TaxID=52696 RepID=A0A919ITU9_9ACTN|nr:hypothetical protein Acy02nite_82630 [Actinoplanes cyaneus]